MLDTPTRSYAGSTAEFQAARQLMPGGVSSSFRVGGHPVPLFFERADGAHLYDVDGNRYIDYQLGMGPNILGHTPEPVIRAVTEALTRGVLFGGQHRAEVEAARRFCALVPGAEQVRFGLTGSELDQAALRLARAHTGKRLVVKFEGHYHGWIDTILVSNAPPLDAAGPPDAPTPHLPSAGQSRAAALDVAVLPWNDLGAVRRYLDECGHETAAIIMEAIGCNTSVIVPREGYLAGVRELCDRHGVVLIFDEVITGFRVGLHGAGGLLGVTPDLMVFAKALGAGFPVAALAGKRSIMERLGDGTVLHGGTFNTNVPSTAATVAALTELARDDGAVYRTLAARGGRLMAGLRAAAARHGQPLHLQGLPAAFNTTFAPAGTEIVDYRSYVRTDLARQREFLRLLQQRGVRVTARGTWFLSAAHTEADIDETLAAADDALRELA